MPEVSLEEAARLIGVAVDSVKRAVAAGRLKLSVEDVLAYAEKPGVVRGKKARASYVERLRKQFRPRDRSQATRESTAKAAARFGVTPRWIRKCLRNGALRSLAPEDLVAWDEARRRRGSHAGKNGQTKFAFVAPEAIRSDSLRAEDNLREVVPPPAPSPVYDPDRAWSKRSSSVKYAVSAVDGHGFQVVQVYDTLAEALAAFETASGSRLWREVKTRTRTIVEVDE